MLTHDQFENHMKAYADAVIEQHQLLEAHAVIKASEYQSPEKDKTLSDLIRAINGITCLLCDIEHALQCGEPADVV